MAEHGLFIGWGPTRSGREAAAGTLFDEAVAYWNGLKAAGEIDELEIVILGAHGGDLSGFALLRGAREKLARVNASPEFQRITMRAEACLDNVGVVHAYVDEGTFTLMTQWREAIADLI